MGASIRSLRSEPDGRPVAFSLTSTVVDLVGSLELASTIGRWHPVDLGGSAVRLRDAAMCGPIVLT
jgi:hypothetical protein